MIPSVRKFLLLLIAGLLSPGPASSAGSELTQPNQVSAPHKSGGANGNPDAFPLQPTSSSKQRLQEPATQSSHVDGIDRTLLSKGSISWDGIRYGVYPRGQPSIEVDSVTIPPGSTWENNSPAISVGYLQEGAVTVESLATHQEKKFKKGDAIQGAANTKYRFRTSIEGAELLVFRIGTTDKPCSFDKKRTAAPNASPLIRQLSHSCKAWDGTDYRAFPEKEPIIFLQKIDIAPGTTVPEHYHPIVFTAYLKKGSITINMGARQPKTFTKGNVIHELLDVPHTGVAGPEPVEIIAVYASYEGAELSVLHK